MIEIKEIPQDTPEDYDNPNLEKQLLDNLSLSVPSTIVQEKNYVGRRSDNLEEWEWDDYEWTLLMAQYGPIYER